MNLLGLVSQASSASAAALPTGYQIERSLRFNSADSAYLSRTPASAGNRKTWTWSAWVKRGRLGVEETLFACGTSASDTAFGQLIFGSDNSFRVNAYFTSWLYTTQQFRDLSAWYHFVVAFDTTQATGSDRVKLYVNGVRVTAFAISNNPSQNTDYAINQAVQHTIGRQDVGPGGYLSAYQADINFIDGQALTPSSFGETDTTTGVWKPKAYSGSYGTNGFYLNFSDNSGTTSTTLGKDRAGSNNWTPNNFSVTAGAGNDSLVDTPTPYGTDTGAGGEVRGNYATLNPLNNGSEANLSNGNLDVSWGGTTGHSAGSTIAVSSGKWYVEFTRGSSHLLVGLIPATYALKLNNWPGNSAYGTNSYSYYSETGNKFNNSSNAAYGASYAQGDVIGVALDLDAGTLVFYKNGVSQGTAYSSITGSYIFAIGYGAAPTGGVPANANFGQRPFAYTAPSGFKALVTTNLPDPTVVQGDDYFNTVLWTGNGSTQSITGVGFQPDLVWIKRRSGSVQSHNLTDAVRGTNKSLTTNGTDAEQNPSLYGQVSAFNSDGFTVASGTSGIGEVNGTSETYAAWNWKAGNSNVTNTAGSITSTVRANTTSGFSIVSYAGAQGSTFTIGHGLGTTPSMFIAKSRNAVENWGVYYTMNGVNTNWLQLNTTAAQGVNNGTLAGGAYVTFNSTTIEIGTTAFANSSSSMIGYAFAAVPGFSAFGKYTGNGSTDGPFVYTGFRPAFLIVKASSSTSEWFMSDATRSPSNIVNKRLQANAANAEDTQDNFDYLSNGFKLRAAAFNNSGVTFIYIAFAENPFKYSLAR